MSVQREMHKKLYEAYLVMHGFVLSSIRVGLQQLCVKLLLLLHCVKLALLVEAPYQCT